MSLPRFLVHLESSGLIALAQTEPDLEYLFQHALIQDAAYASLLKADRRMLHRKIAEVLERTYPQQLDELAPVLGQHYREAGDAPRASAYFIRAGDFELQQYANAEAIATYAQALALTSEPARQIELYLKRGGVLEIVGQWSEAEVDYQAGVALGKQMANAEAIARCEQMLGKLALNRGDYAEARQYLEQSLDLMRERHDSRGVATALHLLGITYFDQGDLIQSTALFEESLALRREIDDQHGLGLSLNTLGAIAAQQGRLDEARGYYDESLALFRSIGDKKSIGRINGNLAEIALRLGDYSVVRAMHAENLKLYQEIGYQSGIADSFFHLGVVAYEQGHYEETLIWYEKALALYRAMGEKQSIASARGGLGDLAYVRKDYQTAHAYFAESLILAREIGDPRNIAYDLILLGAVATGLDQYHKAARLWAAAEPIHMATNVAWGPVELSLYERAKSEAHTALGEDAFNAAWAEGQKMSEAEAIAYALAVATDG